MTLAEWDARQSRIDADLAALDGLVNEAYYSWRNAWFRPWRTFKQRRRIDAELFRLNAELDALIAADVEFSNP